MDNAPTTCHIRARKRKRNKNARASGAWLEGRLIDLKSLIVQDNPDTATCDFLLNAVLAQRPPDAPLQNRNSRPFAISRNNIIVIHNNIRKGWHHSARSFRPEVEKRRCGIRCCFKDFLKHRIPHKFSFALLRKPKRKFCGMTTILVKFFHMEIKWFDYSLSLATHRLPQSSPSFPRKSKSISRFQRKYGFRNAVTKCLK